MFRVSFDPGNNRLCGKQYKSRESELVPIKLNAAKIGQLNMLLSLCIKWHTAKINIGCPGVLVGFEQC